MPTRDRQGRGGRSRGRRCGHRRRERLARGGQRGRRSRRGARSQLRRLPLRPRESRRGSRARRGGAPRPREDRHPRQQRRHDRARACGGAPRRAVGSRARGEPHRPVHPGARARPRHGRARKREDRLRRLAALVPGRDHRAELHGEQVRRRRPDEGTRERVGAARRQRQRRRSRLRPDRQHPGAPRRPGPLRADPRAHPGRPLGRAGGHRRSGRLPLLRRRPTTCTASSFPSTAAGSAGERRRASESGARDARTGAGAACRGAGRRLASSRSLRGPAGGRHLRVEITFRTDGRGGRDSTGRRRSRAWSSAPAPC